MNRCAKLPAPLFSIFIVSAILTFTLAVSVAIALDASPQSGEGKKEKTNKEGEDGQEGKQQGPAKEEEPARPAPRTVMAVVKKCNEDGLFVVAGPGGKWTWKVTLSGRDVVRVFAPIKLSEMASGANCAVLGRMDTTTDKSGNRRNVMMQIQVVVSGDPFESPPRTKEQETLRLTWHRGPAYRSKPNARTEVNGHTLQIGAEAEIVRVRSGTIEADAKAKANVLLRGILIESADPPEFQATSLDVLHPTVVQKYAALIFEPATAPAQK